MKLFERLLTSRTDHAHRLRVVRRQRARPRRRRAARDPARRLDAAPLHSSLKRPGGVQIGMRHAPVAAMCAGVADADPPGDVDLGVVGGVARLDGERGAPRRPRCAPR